MKDQNEAGADFRLVMGPDEWKQKFKDENRLPDLSVPAEYAFVDTEIRKYTGLSLAGYLSWNEMTCEIYNSHLISEINKPPPKKMKRVKSV